MSETTPTTQAKVIRRGISTARGTTRLKFSDSDAKPNGLFLAHLESVDFSMIKIGEETTGMPSFNGLEIPRLRFLFTSNEPDEAKRKYVTLQFTAVESNADTIPDAIDTPAPATAKTIPKTKINKVNVSPIAAK